MTDPRLLQPTTCPDCGRTVVWGPLLTGRWRTFEAEPRPADAVAPGDRWAYSKRRRAMVCLDGEPAAPGRVLVLHFCREYRDKKLMANVEALADMLPTA